jgi:hypothetical protein
MQGLNQKALAFNTASSVAFTVAEANIISATTLKKSQQYNNKQQPRQP